MGRGHKVVQIRKSMRAIALAMHCNNIITVTCFQDPALWACLAGMAATAQDLNTVEVAYAAINEVCVVNVSIFFMWLKM